MRIAGIEKCSFVDYPGHMAAVFFTPGCNWDCFYCHNRSLLRAELTPPWFDLEVAFALLDERQGFLDAVVVSGGEPTLQPGLPDFLRRVRTKGYLIKLDTNGSRPAVLAALLREGLVDYVAMDLKAPMAKYEAVCGVPVDHDAVNHSIDLIMGSGLGYEFRTTVAPQLTAQDILDMTGRIRGARRYVLQQYRRPKNDHSDPRLQDAPHAASWPAEIIEDLETLVDCVDLRGFEIPARRAAYSAA